MSLDELRSLKRKTNRPKETRKVKTLYYGENHFLWSAYLADQKQKGQKLLVSSYPVSEADFNYMGPTSIRGEQNLKALELEEGEGESQFFKELEFRDFSGRMKHEPLLAGEDFFVQKKSEVDPLKYLEEMNTESFQEIIGDCEFRMIKSISHNKDGLFPKFRVVFFDETELLTNKIIWGGSLSELYSLMSESIKADSLRNYLESFVEGHSLKVSLEFENVAVDHKKTLFFPLSYTHPRGHFIGEFHNQGKNGEFIHFFDPGECNEEEVARRIRSLEKTLKKALGANLKIKKEYWKVEKQMPQSSFSPDSELIHKLSTELSDIEFISENAPVPGQVSHFVRGYQSYQKSKAHQN